MKTLKFKTNINCNGCIAKVTPFLNQSEGISTWEVDTANPQKILSINTESLNEGDIVAVIKSAGYNAEFLNE
jgi:copper chaperone